MRTKLWKVITERATLAARVTTLSARRRLVLVHAARRTTTIRTNARIRTNSSSMSLSESKKLTEIPGIHWTKPGFATMELQPTLPALPVPPLDKSLKRYVKSLAPLLNEAELAHSQAAVAEFGLPGGDGERLQALLEQRAEAARSKPEYPVRQLGLEQWS